MVRASIRCAQVLPRPPFYPRTFSYSSAQRRELKNSGEVEEYLSKPSWSVKSLLPSDRQIQESTQVTSEQLHKLLRLSALPPPATQAEEEKMLRDLRAQLHFVKEIQKVDTEGIAPMKSVRGESAALQDGDEITLEKMADALSQEDVLGKYYKRIRRRPGQKTPGAGIEDWDVLGQAPNRTGKFFVVRVTGS